MVASQLGYEVKNMVRVAKWTSDGWPGVIVSYPFREKKVPFPTLYWLTDQRISAAVAALEKDGGVSEAREYLRADEQRVRDLEACHERYRQQRFELMTREDQELATKYFGDTGIAGMRKNFIDVKCLHAHYAHYLGDPDEPRNPIGQWVHDRLPDDIRSLA